MVVIPIIKLQLILDTCSPAACVRRLCRGMWAVFLAWVGVCVKVEGLVSRGGVLKARMEGTVTKLVSNLCLLPPLSDNQQQKHRTLLEGACRYSLVVAPSVDRLGMNTMSNCDVQVVRRACFLLGPVSSDPTKDE